MTLPLAKLGSMYEGCTVRLDAGRANDFAAATNDPFPGYRRGLSAPPVFGAVVGWGPVRSAVADVVPAEAIPTMVHGEHDMHFHRPLVPGAWLATTAEAYSVRVGRSGTSYTVRAVTVDVEVQEPVLEQYLTVFLRGMVGGSDAGPEKPPHAFLDGTRPPALASYTFHVDRDQTVRYAAATGDDLPIHVDDGAARRAGLPGMVVHGLCTLAMAGCALLSELTGGDPVPLRRLAARFARNVLPGDDVTVTSYEVGDRVAGRVRRAFEGHNREGHLVLSHGVAEVDA